MNPYNLSADGGLWGGLTDLLKTGVDIYAGLNPPKPVVVVQPVGSAPKPMQFNPWLIGGAIVAAVVALILIVRK